MMRVRHAGIAAAALMTAFAIAGSMPGRAAPLDPTMCEQLQARLDDLRKDGVEADMEMGPQAARTRLPIDRFNRIGTFIEIDEQLNFRCGLGKQRITLPTAVEGGEEEIPAPGDAAAASGPTPPVAPAAKAPPATKGAAAAATEDPPVKRKAPAKKQPKAAKAGEDPDVQGKPARKAPVRAQPKDGPAKKAAPKKAATQEGAPKKAPAKKAPSNADDAYRPPPRAAAGDGGAAAPAAKQ